MILVTSSWAELFLRNVMELSDGETGTGTADAPGFWGLLRLLRLAKLVRPLRLIGQFRPLWLLMQGLYKACETVMYTSGIICLFLYIFACVALELITINGLREEDPDYDYTVQLYFPDLFTSSVSLTQFVTHDAIALIYRPLVLKNKWLSFFFAFVVMVLSIMLMNLVTAVIVEASREQSETEKAIENGIRSSEFKKSIPQIKQMFYDFDTDGSGMLTISEFEMIPDEVRDALLNILGTDTVNEAFDILDDDQSGTIGIDEFIDSITKVCNSHVDIEMVRLTREFALQKKQVKDVQDVCCNTFDLIRGIQSHLLEHQALAAHNALSAQ